MTKKSTSRQTKPSLRSGTYERYMRLNELLSLQKPEEELAHHDELQFQVVHQVIELWWKLTAFELRSIDQSLREHKLLTALSLMQRIIKIQQLMVSNIRILETMMPWEFHSIRNVPGNGRGGIESPGFRQLMTLSPPLWDDFAALLAHEQVSLIDIYTQADRYPLLVSFAEALVDYDEAFQLFRSQHYKLALRMIGPDSYGTGGMSMEMLELTLKERFYPELWEVRSQLTNMADKI